MDGSKNKEQENWNFPLSIPQNPLKRWIKDGIGRLTLLANPSLKSAILSGKQPQTYAEKAALMSVLIHLEKENAVDAIAKIHRAFWASKEAFGYYSTTNGRMLGMYELVQEELIGAFEAIGKQIPVEKVIEVGCGEGIVLEKLAQELQHIPDFIGIDINETQIKLTAVKFASNKRLSFLAENAIAHFENQSYENAVILTFGGVLEYFTEKEVIHFFSNLYNHKNIGIVLYEPILKEFDPMKEAHTTPYGAELSFCHPYSHYLKEAGFKVHAEKVLGESELNWTLFVASK